MDLRDLRRGTFLEAAHRRKDDGTILAYCIRLPQLRAEAPTVEEAVARVWDLLEEVLAKHLADKIPIPYLPRGTPIEPGFEKGPRIYLPMDS